MELGSGMRTAGGIEFSQSKSPPWSRAILPSTSKPISGTIGWNWAESTTTERVSTRVTAMGNTKRGCVILLFTFSSPFSSWSALRGGRRRNRVKRRQRQGGDNNRVCLSSPPSLTSASLGRLAPAGADKVSSLPLVKPAGGVMDGPAGETRLHPVVSTPGSDTTGTFSLPDKQARQRYHTDMPRCPKP